MIQTIQDNAFLRTLQKEDCGRTPVWIMRQAGRYLPEYRELRAKAGSFLNLVKTPELACEVTLQPLRRFRLDAAILFSDILTIPDAMGLGLSFEEGEGPKFSKKIETLKDIEALTIPAPEEHFQYVTNAIIEIQKNLEGKTPLIGFAGSPWTLACYILEGGKSQNFHRIKKLMYREPETLHKLLRLLAQSVYLYLEAQIRAGVNAVMIFDSWGGILPPKEYVEFSLNYSEEIIKALKLMDVAGTIPTPIPSILYTKNSGLHLKKIAQSGVDAVGIDWTISLANAKRRVNNSVVLQGNMDPGVLLSTPTLITNYVKRILKEHAFDGNAASHIFNLGHGITPDIPVENVQAFVEAIHEYSPLFHQANTP